MRRFRLEGCAPISQGYQSGQMDLTVNQVGYALRRFESYPLQILFDEVLRAPQRSQVLGTTFGSRHFLLVNRVPTPEPLLKAPEGVQLARLS